MAQRVKRPEFSWWPYRTVALAVPLLALAAAVGARTVTTRTGDEATQEVITVFFALLGAGNAYLFAIAIGDLGKTVIAVPIGGFAGFLAVRIFGYPLATQAYVALLGVLILRALWTGLFGTLLGCSGLILATLTFVTLLTLRQGRYEPALGVLCAYPFICGAVAACMPYERTFSGARSAWLAGTLNALAGMIIASGIAFALGFILPTSLAFGGASQMVVEFLAAVGLALVLCAANFFCAKRLFYSVYRVSDATEDAPSAAAPAASDEAPATKPAPAGPARAPEPDAGALPPPPELPKAQEPGAGASAQSSSAST